MHPLIDGFEPHIRANLVTIIPGLYKTKGRVIFVPKRRVRVIVVPVHAERWLSSECGGERFKLKKQQAGISLVSFTAFPGPRG